MLMKKLSISQYHQSLSSDGVKEMSLVKIPTQRHVGARAVAMVTLGQHVKRGDIIAQSPSDQLGSIYHASIHGKVSDLSDTFIEITGPCA